jgi:hypothetical protein
VGKNKRKKDSENFTEASGDDFKDAKLALEGILNDPVTKNDPSKTKLFSFLLNILNSYIFIIGLLQKKNFKISNLKRMLFGSRSEKSPSGKPDLSSKDGLNSGIIVPPYPPSSSDQDAPNSDKEQTSLTHNEGPEIKGDDKDKGKKKENSRTRRKNARAELAAMGMKTTQGP